ncbi:hypothetical protein ACLKA7_017078 [Drosophila subpalustris]
MSMNNLEIKSLRSFQELTESDKQLCYDSFIADPLEDKHRQNKYIKRSEQIVQRSRTDPMDNECFLSFDVYPMNFKYCTVIFGLCGITHHFFNVLYLSVIEETKLESPDQFICDLLANIIIVEIPKLKSFLLKFVLCRNNAINERVLKLFAESRKTSKFYNTFPFICEPNELKHAQLHDPYAQRAWQEIMQGNLFQTTVRDVFQKYRQIAEERNNEVLKQFVDHFFNLSRDLLDNRFQVNLRLCTMERMDNFERIIRAHMKSYKDESVTRLFLFDLIRALVHIYGF